MDPAAVAGIGGVAAGAICVAVGARDLAVARRDRVQDYLSDLTPDQEREPDEYAERLARPFTERVVAPLVGRVVAAASAVTASDHRVRVRTRLAQAGLDTTIRPEVVIAAQAAGLVVGLAIGLALLLVGAFSPLLGVLTVLALAGLGVAAPIAWVARRREARVAGIRRDLPETLDLLAISVEAGLGLEAALEVVVEQNEGPLAEELARTLQEMELGLSRRDALSNLRGRSPVPELAAFVQALVQADVLGMPLARVLSTQADDMRARRRQWAREAAAKLPVKILFPLVGCIFPAVLVVILGPALSEIGGAF